MIEVVGYSMVGYSVAMGVYYKMTTELSKEKQKLKKAFVDGNMYKPVKGKNKTYRNYPKIMKARYVGNMTALTFRVPKGFDPEIIVSNLYVFRQHFGEDIELSMNDKQGMLRIYKQGLPDEFDYDTEQVQDSVKTNKLPIVCGQNLKGELYTFDMVRHPHMLIAGETGSGKSSELISILTTLINHKSPKQLRFILGDLKRSEFHVFKGVEHVDGVYHSAEELNPILKKTKKEMTRRGNLLDKAGVNSIDELEKKPPYIMVCIDEVALLKKEKDIMDILEEISSIGRSLGVFIVLSMQRPDSKLLDGKLKVNLTVRMGFKTEDSMNAKIIGTKGSENLKNQGRMLLKVNSEIQEIQCPLLTNDRAKELLQPFKVVEHPDDKKEPEQEETTDDQYNKVVEMFRNE